MIEVTIENADEFGRFCEVTREYGDEELIKSVHRTMIEPGRFQGDEFVATDIDTLSDEARAFAKKAWTKSTVAKFKTVARQNFGAV